MPRTAAPRSRSLKLGETIPARVCEDPVADQYALARQFGLTGTSGIVTEDGKLIRGFESTDDLLAALETSSQWRNRIGGSYVQPLRGLGAAARPATDRR